MTILRKKSISALLMLLIVKTVFKFHFRLAKVLTCLLLLPHPCDLKQTQGGAVLQSVD